MTKRFDWLFRPQVADEDLPLSAEARFAEALAELPAVERSALALSEIGGLDPEEIAERLGTEPAVVGKLLLRARATVRTSLAVRSPRGLVALLPLQTWWQSGSAAPAMRAAGVVASVVVGTGVATGGASADALRPPLVAPDAARSQQMVEQAAPAVRPAQPVARVARAVTRTPSARATKPVRVRAMPAAARVVGENTARPPRRQGAPIPAPAPRQRPDARPEVAAPPRPAPAATPPARPVEQPAKQSVEQSVEQTVGDAARAVPRPRSEAPAVAAPVEVPTPPALPELPATPPVPLPTLP